MKFKELREANLSKAQINKVHDKADDLPKNDFIKRYGKDGDSVRFATATKMVKKELGIEDYEEGFKSDAQRKAAFASGYKEKGKKKEEVELDEGPKFDIKKIDNGGIYTHGLYYNGNLVSGLESTDKKYVEKIKNTITKKMNMGEDAPANATGSAVVGTGDDSSTVVVKKKKPLQDKLMKRMGIKEAIDRAVPDLEYEVDEITRRTNQLKEMALKEKTVPKDKDTDQPKKYVSGLSDKDKKAHDRHLEKGSKKSDSDKSAYKQSPADKKAKTKPSVHTKKYKQMFGENDLSLDEAIKGLQKKAEKSGMPYSILKQVYNRGMAAWKGGHRPGTTPQQWAFARVNSFITKSSGTWGKADKDLAAKVRGS